MSDRQLFKKAEQIKDILLSGDNVANSLALMSAMASTSVILLANASATPGLLALDRESLKSYILTLLEPIQESLNDARIKNMAANDD